MLREKVVLMQAVRTCEGVNIKLHSFLNLTVGGGDWSASRASSFGWITLLHVSCYFPSVCQGICSTYQPIIACCLFCSHSLDG